MPKLKEKEKKNLIKLIAIKGRYKDLVVYVPEEAKEDFLKRYKDFKEMEEENE